MKLYGSLTSPYVRKVRIVAREKELALDFVTADAWGANSPIPRLNPLGKVPVFERDDGQVMFDSPLICEYLDSLKAPPLIPPTGEARWQVLQIHALAQGMLDATVARMLESRRPEAQRSTDAIARQEQKIASALDYADKRVSDRPYLVGTVLTLADIALGVALDYLDFRYAHRWRDKHAALGRWSAAIAARSAFAQTLPPDFTRP